MSRASCTLLLVRCFQASAAFLLLLGAACAQPPIDTRPADTEDTEVADTDTDLADTEDTAPPTPRLAPDFALVDTNPASATYDDPVSPRDYLQKVSGWYVTHAT